MIFIIFLSNHYKTFVHFKFLSIWFQCADVGGGLTNSCSCFSSPTGAASSAPSTIPGFLSASRSRSRGSHRPLPPHLQKTLKINPQQQLVSHFSWHLTPKPTGILGEQKEDSFRNPNQETSFQRPNILPLPKKCFPRICSWIFSVCLRPQNKQ